MQAVDESVGQLEVGTVGGREQTVGGRDGGDERGTIAVGISDEEEEEMIDGNALEGLLVNRTQSPPRSVCEGGGPQDRCIKCDVLGFRKRYGLHRKGSR